MTSAMAIQPMSPRSPSQSSMPHRQTGFHIDSPRSESQGHDIAPPPSNGISPLAVHSPNDYSSLLVGSGSNGGLFDLGAMRSLDLEPLAHGPTSPSSHALHGSYSHHQHSQSVPRYFSAPQHSASPHEIFSPRPETQAGNSSLADDLTASLSSPQQVPVPHHHEHKRSSSSGKAPSAAVSNRNARRFSVSSASGSPSVNTGTSPPAPMRWFDQTSVSLDGPNTPGGDSDFGSQWASPLPSAAIDMGHLQPHLQHGIFMPSSAPASSTSFTLGRAPGGRPRNENSVPPIPSALSDVGEEHDGHSPSVGEQSFGRVNDKRRKRRESHNLVERRRRDHINQAISDLSHLVPAIMLEPQAGATGLTHHHVHNPAIIASSPTFAVDEFGSPTAAGAVLKPNKGLILERSVDYIKLLQQQVASLSAHCQSLKESVSRLGGDPSLAGSSPPTGLHRRESSNGAGSESSGAVDIAVDIEHALGSSDGYMHE